MLLLSIILGENWYKMFFINILLHRWLSKLITYSTNCLKCRLDCFPISCSNVSKLAILENDSLRMKQILNIHFPSLLLLCEVLPNLICYKVCWGFVVYDSHCKSTLLTGNCIQSLHMTDVLILMMRINFTSKKWFWY